jgi:uncharacterized membrane protein YgdD (TMEM256/DUF423 family)
MTPSRFFMAAGGLSGAAGVALSAAAAHQGGGTIGTAAAMLLAHAPALLTIGLAGGSRLLRIGAGVLLAGLVVFSLDLVSRQYLGHRLFPFAAPTGGTAMILGWLAIAGAGALWPRARPEG